VSTEGQAADDRASIPAQRAINRRTALAFNLTIAHTIQITDVSGAAILFAPEMRELLERIKSPNIHGVVAREFSRLMRPEDFSDYGLLQAFVESQTVLYLPEGPIDFSNKMGRVYGVMQAAWAGAQRIEFLENAWNAKEEKRKAGKFPQSRICLPFGVSYVESAGWSYTEDAATVKEMFRLFLSGETSYWTIGRLTGVAPFNVRNILRNPIYTGWRVIDKRRDPSPSARRTKRDGRQGDRPKIERAPEDVIRVKVLDAPLISELDFARVQQLIETKKRRHWRTRTDYTHRFTYNGFLTCSTCGRPIHTVFSRKDYYVCTARKHGGTCRTAYMRRDTLDPHLDALFAERLCDEGFLRELDGEAARRRSRASGRASAHRLETSIAKLEAKRGRVFDAYFEGDIDKGERDERREEIDRQIAHARRMLRNVKPFDALPVKELAEVFTVFLDWPYLSRRDKREALTTLEADVRAANHTITGLFINLPRSIQENRKGKDS
jgi:hypothetical protein